MLRAGRPGPMRPRGTWHGVASRSQNRERDVGVRPVSVGPPRSNLPPALSCLRPSLNRSSQPRRRALALRAMPAAARVVGDLSVGAIFASRHVAAQRCRTTALDGRHDIQLVEAVRSGNRRIIGWVLRRSRRSWGLDELQFTGCWRPKSRQSPICENAGAIIHHCSGRRLSGCWPE